MWSRWKKLTDIQRSQLAGVGAIAVLLVVLISMSSSGGVNESAPAEFASEAAPDAPFDGYDVTSTANQASMQDQDSSAGSVPPTAVVDGVTYSGEQQIEALIQAAREAGLNEEDARRAGREAAILCNGNPECLK